MNADSASTPAGDELAFAGYGSEAGRSVAGSMRVGDSEGATSSTRTGRSSASYTLPGGVLTLNVTTATDVGHVRAVNEDSLSAQYPAFVVADGMGGHDHGDRASQTTVAVFRRDIAGGPSSPDAIGRAIATANAEVRAFAAESGLPGAVSGTTLTGLAIVELDEHAGAHEGVYWLVFNVGDSRVYRWNPEIERVERLTVDHSAVQELVNVGYLTEEEAEVHPDRNMITRAIGADEVTQPDAWLMPIEPHQFFVICSDGLTKELTDAELSQSLADLSTQGERVEHLAVHLTRLALEAGGHDNISVITIESFYEAHPGDEDAAKASSDAADAATD